MEQRLFKCLQKTWIFEQDQVEPVRPAVVRWHTDIGIHCWCHGQELFTHVLVTLPPCRSKWIVPTQESNEADKQQIWVVHPAVVHESTLGQHDSTLWRRCRFMHRLGHRLGHRFVAGSEGVGAHAQLRKVFPKDCTGSASAPRAGRTTRGET